MPIKLKPEEANDLLEACKSDSTKIIEYLENKEAKNKFPNKLQFVLIVVTFLLSLITFLINELPKIIDWLLSAVN